MTAGMSHRLLGGDDKPKVIPEDLNDEDEHNSNTSSHDKMPVMD